LAGMTTDCRAFLFGIQCKSFRGDVLWIFHDELEPFRWSLAFQELRFFRLALCHSPHTDLGWNCENQFAWWFVWLPSISPLNSWRFCSVAVLQFCSSPIILKSNSLFTFITYIWIKFKFDLDWATQIFIFFTSIHYNSMDWSPYHLCKLLSSLSLSLSLESDSRLISIGPTRFWFLSFSFSLSLSLESNSRFTRTESAILSYFSL
jgi:hypothetical protein